jgi:hypothetical protein
LEQTYLDEALYYMDQITAERLQEQLVAISVACSPQYKENDRRELVAKLDYQVKKLRWEDEENVDDVDDATVKRNMSKLKSFFGSKKQGPKEKQT